MIVNNKQSELAAMNGGRVSLKIFAQVFQKILSKRQLQHQNEESHRPKSRRENEERLEL